MEKWKRGTTHTERERALQVNTAAMAISSSSGSIGRISCVFTKANSVWREREKSRQNVMGKWQMADWGRLLLLSLSLVAGAVWYRLVVLVAHSLRQRQSLAVPFALLLLLMSFWLTQVGQISLSWSQVAAAAHYGGSGRLNTAITAAADAETAADHTDHRVTERTTIWYVLPLKKGF